MKKIPLFILTYNNGKELNKFLKSFKTQKLEFFIVDNGNQNIALNNVARTYTSSVNIGCAGGWNLISRLAFEHLGFNKILITQDDVIFSEEQAIKVFNSTDEFSIVGLLKPFFEFSFFGLAKDTYSLVGKFDENCLFVYSEDADYKHRCYLNNIKIYSLFESAVNKSASIKNDSSINKIQQNRQYIKNKWGDSIHPSPIASLDCQPPFKYKSPFLSGYPSSYIPITHNLRKQYPNYQLKDTFVLPSDIEYDKISNK